MTISETCFSPLSLDSVAKSVIRKNTSRIKVVDRVMTPSSNSEARTGSNQATIVHHLKPTTMTTKNVDQNGRGARTFRSASQRICLATASARLRHTAAFEEI